MRIQLLFAKTEAMRFTGHLDLHKALERNFRRAGLPLAYSQGFNPRPKLVLASPLPLGYTSQAELAEAWLNESVPVQEILESLIERAPPGIDHLQIEAVPADSAKLPNRLASAEYQARLEESIPKLDENITSLLGMDSLLWERGEKRYDLRPMIEALALSAENGKQHPIVVMRLAARPGATGRPDDVLDALGIPPRSAQVHRTRLVLTGDPP
jgi:radical SAM-linked protein